MAIYAIGDIQGCNDALQELVQSINFNPAEDQLWFTGDLVNRGPNSLEVLRYVRSLGNSAISVLGNHDLHLLAVAYGYAPEKKEDTLLSILSASDKDDLLGWIRNRPLLHHDSELGITLVHAGMAPQWSLKTAIGCANEVEEILRGNKFERYLKHMYGNKPDKWDKKLSGYERLRFITNCFTRLRYVDEDGKLCLRVKGAPGSQAEGFYPWFKLPDRKNRDEKIVFGHWSTLGFYAGENVIGIDSGCLWGGELTAIRLDVTMANNMQVIQMPCEQQKVPPMNV